MNVTPINRPARTVLTLEDTRIEVFPNGNICIRPHDSAAYLGVFDLAEVLRIACETDAKVLEVLAQIMRNGHRFRDDFIQERFDYDEEEPF